MTELYECDILVILKVPYRISYYARGLFSLIYFFCQHLLLLFDFISHTQLWEERRKYDMYKTHIKKKKKKTYIKYRPFPQ